MGSSGHAVLARLHVSALRGERGYARTRADDCAQGFQAMEPAQQFDYEFVALCQPVVA